MDVAGDRGILVSDIVFLVADHGGDLELQRLLLLIRHLADVHGVANEAEGLVELQHIALEAVGEGDLPLLGLFIIDQPGGGLFVAVQAQGLARRHSLGHGVGHFVAVDIGGQVVPGSNQVVAGRVRRDGHGTGLRGSVFLGGRDGDGSGHFLIVRRIRGILVVDVGIGAAQGEGDVRAQAVGVIHVVPDLGRLDLLQLNHMFVGQFGYPGVGVLVVFARSCRFGGVAVGSFHLNHIVLNLVAVVVLGQVGPAGHPSRLFVSFGLGIGNSGIVRSAVHGDVADLSVVRVRDVADFVNSLAGDIALIVQHVYSVLAHQAEGDLVGPQAVLVVFVVPLFLGLDGGLLDLMGVGQGGDDGGSLIASQGINLSDLAGGGVIRPEVGVALIDLGFAILTQEILFPGVGEDITVYVAGGHTAHQIDPAVGVVQHGGAVSRGLLKGLVFAHVSDRTAVDRLDIGVAFAVIIGGHVVHGGGLIQVDVNLIRTDAVAVVVVVPHLGDGDAVIADVGIGEDDLRFLHALVGHDVGSFALHLGQHIPGGHAACVFLKDIARAGGQTADGEVVVGGQVEGDVTGLVVNGGIQLVVVVLNLGQLRVADGAVGFNLHGPHHSLIGDLRRLVVNVLLPHIQVEDKIGVSIVGALHLFADGKAVLGLTVNEADAGGERAVSAAGAVLPAHGFGDRLHRGEIDLRFVNLVSCFVSGGRQMGFVGDLIELQAVRIHLQNQVVTTLDRVHMGLDNVNRIVVGDAGIRGISALAHTEVIISRRIEGHLGEFDGAVFVLYLLDEVPDDFVVGFAGVMGFGPVQQRHFVLQEVQSELELLVVGGVLAVNRLSGVHGAIEADQRAALVGRQMALSGGVNAVDDHAAVEVAAGNHRVGAGRDHMAELGIVVPGIHLAGVGIIVNDGDAAAVVHSAGQAAMNGFQLRDAVLAAAGEGDDRAGERFERLVHHIQFDSDIGVFGGNAVSIVHADFLARRYRNCHIAFVGNCNSSRVIAVQRAGLTEYAVLQRGPVYVVIVRDRVTPSGHVHQLPVQQHIAVQDRVDLTHIEIVIVGPHCALSAADELRSVCGAIIVDRSAHRGRRGGLCAAADIDEVVDDQVFTNQNAGHGVLVVHKVTVVPGGAVIGVYGVRLGADRDDVVFGQQGLKRIVGHMIVVLAQIDVVRVYALNARIVVVSALRGVRNVAIINGRIGNNVVCVHQAIQRYLVVDQRDWVVHDGSGRHAGNRHGDVVFVSADLVIALPVIVIAQLLEPVFIRNLYPVCFAAVHRVVRGQLRVRVQSACGCGGFHQGVEINAVRQHQRLVAAVNLHIVLGRVGNAVVDGSFVFRITNLSGEGIAVIVTRGQAVCLVVKVSIIRGVVLALVADTDGGTGGGDIVPGSLRVRV